MKFLQGTEALQYQNWATMPNILKGEEFKMVYLAPNGRRWDLLGPLAGRQGVQLSTEIHGLHHPSFQHLFTEGAYQEGATYERTNILKRVIDIGIMVGSGTRKLSKYQYQLVESNWWDSWPLGVTGWLGMHSRFGGWRWVQVMQASPVNTTVSKSPIYANNNHTLWSMQIVAPKPYFAKRTLVTTWKAHPQTHALHGYDEETITICNRGNVAVWPKFVYSGPGRAWVQDGVTSRLVPLPLLDANDGYVLVDTDPGERMLTASKDPVDNIFYQWARSSRILDFFLHDIADLGLPVWRRANGIRFNSQIPPRTTANIKVRHDHAGGTVSVLVPQRWSRPV